MAGINDIFFLLGGIVIGLISGYLLMLRTNTALKKELLTHETRQAIEKELREKTKADEDSMMQNFRDSFSALSSQALRDNNEEFLKLARENFSKQQMTVETRLNEKERAFSEMVSPIKEILKQTDEQLKKLEADRQQTHGSISQYLQNMTETQHQLHSETRNLVQALSLIHI